MNYAEHLRSRGLWKKALALLRAADGDGLIAAFFLG